MISSGGVGDEGGAENDNSEDTDREVEGDVAVAVAGLAETCVSEGCTGVGRGEARAEPSHGQTTSSPSYKRITSRPKDRQATSLTCTARTCPTPEENQQLTAQYHP